MYYYETPLLFFHTLSHSAVKSWCLVAFVEGFKFHCKETVLTLGTEMSEQFNKSPLAAITGVINRLPGSLNLNQCCCALIVPETLVAAVTGANLLALTEHSHKNIPDVSLHPSGRIQELFFFFSQSRAYGIDPGLLNTVRDLRINKTQRKTIAFQFHRSTVL